MQLIRLSENDLPEVVEAWNATLAYDQVTEEQLHQVIFDDPNYEPEGVLVARGDDGSVQGLSVCVLRRTVEGKDGRGGPREFRTGYLKGFFVHPGLEEGEVAAHLLAAAEAYCRAAGKTELLVGEYTHSYVSPGVDLRYERLREILASNGYRDTGVLDDMAADLDDPALPIRLKRARERAGSEVQVVPWRPELLARMRQFVAEDNSGFRLPGWEEQWAEPRDDVLILKKGEEILGWARYGPSPPSWVFGPMVVLERERRKGYGTLLVLESVMRAKEQGGEHMWAGWVTHGPYLAAGWSVSRRYAIFVKDLDLSEGAD